MGSVTRLLHQTCTITRQPVETGTDDDLVLGVAAAVPATETATISCSLTALRVSEEALALGPLPRDVRLLVLEPTQDLATGDVVTVDTVKYVVVGVPQTHSLAGVDHHVEAVVERKAVQ